MKPNTVGRVDGTDRHTGHFSAYLNMDTGLIEGAQVLTLDGEIPVAFLSVGDRLITRDAGASRVRHIQRISRATRLIALSAGSLGQSRGKADTKLAGDQMVLIRDWRARAMFNSERALVAARTLVDDEFITDLGIEETTLFQVFCDRPHIIYADGLELGTADGAKARGSVLRAA